MIHVSTTLRGKMAGMTAISTNLTRRCAKRSKVKGSVCSHCYVNRTPAHWAKPVRSVFERNAALLRGSVLPIEDLPTLTAQYCRLEALGELENKTQLINYYNIARKNPNTRFVLWTKEVAIAQSVDKPANVTLIYSSPMIDKRATLPKGFNKVFTVYSTDTGNINCGGRKCIECLRCYKGNTRYINELKK